MHVYGGISLVCLLQMLVCSVFPHASVFDLHIHIYVIII